MEELALATHQSLPSQATWRQARGCVAAWQFAKGSVADVPNACRSDGHDEAMVSRSRFVQSVREMERVCSQAVNRLVRTRMLGGVGGARCKPAPIPIALLSIQLRQVDPINSVWEFAIQESDYVTVTDQ